MSGWEEAEEWEGRERRRRRRWIKTSRLMSEGGRVARCDKAVRFAWRMEKREWMEVNMRERWKEGDGIGVCEEDCESERVC